MRLFPRLLLVLALLFAVPLSADSTVALSTIDIVPFGDPAETVVACGPSSCAVAWITRRIASTAFVERLLYVRTYAPDGTPLQIAAVRVSGPFSHEPSLIWNGSEYLVTWIEPGCGEGGKCGGVGAVRVSENGSVVGSPRTIRAIPIRGQSAAYVVGWNGSTYLLWVEGVLYRLNRDLEVIASRPTEPVLALTSDGDRFLLVVNRGGRLLAQILSSDGALLFEPELAPTAAAVTPAAASFNGQSFGVVWTSGSSVEAAEVTPAGAISFRTRLSAVAGFQPSLIWRNFLWTAAWQSSGTFCSASFAEDFVRARCLEHPADEQDLALGGSSSSAVAAWISAPDFPARVNVDFLDRFEEPAFTADRIASEAVRQYRLPSIARNTGGSAVAWSDFNALYVGGRNDDGTLRPVVAIPTGRVLVFQVVGAPQQTLVLWEEQTFIDAYAAVLDTNNQLVAAPVRVGNNLPAAAFDGQGWRLVWSDDVTLRVLTTRIGLDGSRSSETLVAETGMFQYSPDVACDGASGCVAVWDENDTSDRARIQAARIGTGEAWAVASGRVFEPSIAWNGNHYLVAWETPAPGSILSYRAARVDRDARRLFPADEQGFPIFDGYWSRGIHLVAWSNGRTIAFSPDGQSPLTTTGIVASAGDSVQRLPMIPVRAMDIATDGDRIFITYEENGRIMLQTITAEERRRAVRR
jgi:hypothetical protein